MKKFILDGHNPVEELDIKVWGEWMDNNTRKVANTELPDDVRVSTVFLAIDHNFSDTGRPVLFETLVFGGKLDGQMTRSCTWIDAEFDHVVMLKKALGW